MGNRTKQEHHIPLKSYLDYFVDESIDNQLWVYLTEEVKDSLEKSTPKNISPINFCKEANFYESPLYKVNAIEKTLADIEGDYKTVLEEKILKKLELFPEDKHILSQFISTLEMRTTASKENINNFINRVSKQFSSLEKQFNKGNLTENHKELLKLKEQNIAFTQSVDLSLQVNRWQFSDFLFLFIRNPDDEFNFFISSDHPTTLFDMVSMNSIYGVPPLSTTAEVILPLTPSVAVFVNNLGINGSMDIDLNFIAEVNNRTLYLSNHYVISPHKLTSKFMNLCTKRVRQSFALLALTNRLHKEWADRHGIK